MNVKIDIDCSGFPSYYFERVSRRPSMGFSGDRRELVQDLHRLTKQRPPLHNIQAARSLCAAAATLVGDERRDEAADLLRQAIVTVVLKYQIKAVEAYAAVRAKQPKGGIPKKWGFSEDQLTGLGLAAFGDLLGVGSTSAFEQLVALRDSSDYVSSKIESLSTGQWKFARKRRALLWLPEVTSDRTLRRQTTEWSSESDTEPPIAGVFLNVLASHLKPAPNDEPATVLASRSMVPPNTPEIGAKRSAEEATASHADGAANRSINTKIVRIVSSATPTSPLTSAFPVGYVARPELQKRFAEAVQRGEKVIVFVGQHGMGKSALAKAVAAQACSPRQPPVIRFNSSYPSLADVKAALIAHGRPHEHLTVETTREQVALELVSLICGEEAPEYVVLDNLQRLDELTAMLPSSPTSTVVATCLETGHVVQDQYCKIEVGVMSENEAVKQLLELAPLTNQEEARSMVAKLGFYPLLIRYIVGRATATGANLTELADNLQQLSINVTTVHGQRLHIALAESLDIIRADHPAALDLLGAIVSAPVDEDGLIDDTAKAFMEVLEGTYVEAISDSDEALFQCFESNGAYADAIEVLRRYLMVDTEQKSRGRKLLTVHPHTKLVLRDLLTRNIHENHIKVKNAFQEVLDRRGFCNKGSNKCGHRSCTAVFATMVLLPWFLRSTVNDYDLFLKSSGAYFDSPPSFLAQLQTIVRVTPTE